MITIDKEMQSKITPMQALDILKAGNKRFMNNLKMNRNLLQQVNETKAGQYPVAIILSCIDSRVSAELIFDQGLGDIFSVRVAGNVLNDDVLASMEFSCKVAGSKMVMVLGHTKCGAVSGACKGVKMGHLTQLLDKLKPAIDKTVADAKYTLTPDNMVDVVAENNVHITIDSILQRSEILRTMVEEGSIGIAGGMYDIETGGVTFFEEDIRMKAGRVVAV